MQQKLWVQILRKVITTVRGTRKIKAINTINSLIVTLRDCGGSETPGSLTVFKAEPHFNPDSLLVKRCNWVLHSSTTKAVVEEVWDSLLEGSHSVSLCVPSLWEGSPRLSSSSSSSSLCRGPPAARSWSHNCWGTVPAFPEVVRSTTRRHLTDGDKQVRLTFRAEWSFQGFFLI